MTKEFCDRCGKEIKYMDDSYVLKGMLGGPLGNIRADLCNECGIRALEKPKADDQK